MTVFDRMKQKKKEEYTLGELVIAYLCGYVLTIVGGLTGATLSIFAIFGACGAEGIQWTQSAFLGVVCLFLMVFGIGVYNYLDMGRW